MRGGEHSLTVKVLPKYARVEKKDQNIDNVDAWSISLPSTGVNRDTPVESGHKVIGMSLPA